MKFIFNHKFYSYCVIFLFCSPIIMLLPSCGPGAQSEINNLDPPVFLFEETEDGRTVVLRDGNGDLHSFSTGDQFNICDRVVILAISSQFDVGELVTADDGKILKPPRPRNQNKKIKKETQIKKMRERYKEESQLQPLKEDTKDLDAIGSID
jgi:hypothetical protein